MKPTLQLRATQQLAMTPQLQQSIRLLQLSTLELQAEIEQALLENPLLERAEPEDGAQEDEVEPVRVMRVDDTRRGDGDSDFDDWLSQQAAPAPALADHLLAQLAATRLSDREKALVEALIGELDDNGYLRTPLGELAELFAPEVLVSVDELQVALRLLQSFDPPGVAARDLSECLLLQLREPDLKQIPDLADVRVLELARVVCREHLQLLAARDYARLRRLLRCDEAILRKVQAVIQRLDPRPGARFGGAVASYVVPDIIVRKVNGRWRAELNEAAVPRLKVNQVYADLLRGSEKSELYDQLREARWLIRNIQQRCSTLLRVAQEIVRRQEGFFEHGAIAMRPLVLRDIAEALDLHESTISRVTTQKYMQTPHGTLELKRFFGSQVSTQAGGTASATAVQTLIKQMLAEENPRKPLSDNQIAQLLLEQGVVVARRTVAKYREAMNIPPASQRKRL